MLPKAKGVGMYNFLVYRPDFPGLSFLKFASVAEGQHSWLWLKAIKSEVNIEAFCCQSYKWPKDKIFEKLKNRNILVTIFVLS